MAPERDAMMDGRRKTANEGRQFFTLLVLLLSVLLFAACEPNASPNATTPPRAQLTSQPTNEPTHTPTSQPSNTPTPVPSQTPTPLPSPTPAPALKRLTDGQCCTQPFWSPDSTQVLFIDKPNPQAPAGIYAVGVGGTAEPKLLTERVAFYTSDMQYAQNIDGAFAVITRTSDGQQWRVRSGGRSVLLSPDRTRVVWNETPQVGPNETRVTTVMGANIDGGDARPVTTVLRGSASAWLDNQRLLMSARLNRNTQEVSAFVYSLADGHTTELVKSERLRTVSPSPTGEWIAYTIVFDKNADQNGLWVVRSDGSSPKKLGAFGAFQWRDPQRLVVVPLDLSKTNHTFVEFDATSGGARQLTDERAAFKIANGDWAVSPDGRKIVFLNAADSNLWLWTFPN
ncbi:MAG: hypothetical protein LC737_06610 [Chloroflexi bacterium]|nr:hypothetical protein [Chloroflexota bacterium]